MRTKGKEENSHSRKLNLGCGESARKGWINIDLIKYPGVNLVYDLNKFPYPFKDNGIEEVFCSHSLEHFSDVGKIIRELYRICGDGAIIRIRVPHFSSFIQYVDPTHKTPFAYWSFDDLLDDFVQEIKYNSKGKSKDNKIPLFKILKRKLNYTRMNAKFLNIFINPILNINPIMYERFFCWIFPCSEVLFELKMVKNERERAEILKKRRILT